MILFISDEMLPFVLNKRDGSIFNLSSYYDVGVDVGNLFPHDNFPYIEDGDDFEKVYVPWLLTTKEAFLDFVSIVMGDYYSQNSYVMFQPSPLTVLVMDCLITMIRKRYGKTSFIVYTLDDMMKTYDTPMSDIGLQTFMQDKKLHTEYSFVPECFEDMLEKAERYNGTTL